MNIERKIGFKAAGLYSLTGILVVMVSIYSYHLREEIQHQRAESEHQHALFSLINEFTLTVNEAQLAGSKFIATNDKQHIDLLELKILSIDSLISIFAEKKFEGLPELKHVRHLIGKQEANINLLSRYFGSENPLTGVHQRLQEIKPPAKEHINVVTIREDTLIKPTEKKKFFRRLRDVFIPDEDSTIFLTNQRIDTLKMQVQDSVSYLTEVDTITRRASRQYEQNIRKIEQQLSMLVYADREIASQLSSILMRLHEQTLVSVIDAIDKSEKSIRKNYAISVVGGIIALILILVFILLITHDVNKGKQAREKLRQVLESRHQLLLSVSHDIKSPLSSILAYLELKSQAGEDTRALEHAAKHILAMLENLLEFSSLDQGKLQLNITTLELSELGVETVEMFQTLAKAKGLELQYEASVAQIRTDEIKVKQIIINLISNAIKYTSRGKITIELGYRDGILDIRVKDTGAGIPMDKLNDIFKPFTRIESNNALAHGSGFGLYVVKGLTDLLGGTIRIESEVKNGTTIEISIPAEQSIINLSNETKKIEVYEDDPLMKDLVCSMLRELGHTPVNEQGDIILTDMEMGEISGVDILKKAGRTPVILMTGRGDFTVEMAFQLGFAGYIPKPLTIRELKAVFGEGERKEEDSFFAQDDEEIMQLFRCSTIENQQLLLHALESEDYAKAQAISHKMLPMFAQLGYTTDALLRMDAHRGKPYDGWQDDVREILSFKV